MTHNLPRVDALVPESEATTTPLTIGVTGHRPARLCDADLDVVRGRARDVLTAIQTTNPASTTTVLPPLAEGADQIVARVALDMGYRLACALPFQRDAYALDFAMATAKAEYHALLMLAEAVVELDGTRTTPEERDIAYAAVGAYTVAHADAMIAIWDGQQARGNGGTAQVVDMALDAGVPVIWIPAARPHETRVLSPGADGTVTNATLSAANLLGLPRPHATR